MSFPSVSASSSASGKLDQSGSGYQMGSGDFTINQSGSGISNQNATSSGFSIPKPVYIIGAVAVLWFVLRR